MTTGGMVHHGRSRSGTAADRVRATRRLLAAALFASAVLRALAAVLAVVALAAIADMLWPMSIGLRQWVRPSALVAGSAAILLTLWRGRELRSLERVALWIEERIPWLHYALVTSLDRRFGDSHPALEPVVGRAQWGGLVAREWWRAIRVPSGIAVAAVLLLVMLPDRAASRAITPRAGDSVDRSVPGVEADPLSPIAATIVPPGYSRLPREIIDEPQTISALPGSAVTLRGRGSAARLVATIGDRQLAPRDSGARWAVTVAMPGQPAAVRLTASGRDRWVVLEPRPDAAPVVRLGSPARDTVLRAAAGTIPLVADAHDDLGLARAGFEVIISSGQGESFSFRTLTLGALQLGGAARTDLRASVKLDSLALVPGDVLHIRAVARDENSVSGPGQGVSETRSVRIARPGEYDSVAVDGAPPPEVDKSLLSQRMLILVTERLHARRNAIERPVLLAESRGIATDQGRLRQRVGELVFIRLEGEDTGEHAHGPGDGHAHGPEDLGAMTPEQVLAAAEAATAHDGSAPLDFAEGESPVVSINRPLLEAYNAMWLAGSELEQGAPGRALPHMRVALAALQRARAAERVYLRGRPPAVVVDVADARMTGGERGAPAPRESADPSGEASMRRAVRFDRALGLLATAPASAADSLLLLRIDALGSAPAFAAALGDAIGALRTGRDATGALAIARRALSGPPSARASLHEWGTAP